MRLYGGAQELTMRCGAQARSEAVLRLVILIVIGLAIGQAARALFVDVEFFGGVDIAAFETYAWREGNRAANFEVEAAIRAAVEERLDALGYRRLESGAQADAFVVTRVLKDIDFPAGVLKVEVTSGATEELVWQGMATGVVAAEKPAKIAKILRRSIRKMFKQFPGRETSGDT